MLSEQLEVWGYKTYRPFRIYWILKEYGLTYKSHKIGSRTGETQTNDYLKMNPKGKIPLLKHKNQIITESFAAVSYITYHFNKRGYRYEAAPWLVEVREGNFLNFPVIHQFKVNY